MNAAAASMNAIINVHRGLIARCLRVTLPHASQTGSSFVNLERIEAAVVANGGSGTTVTVPSDPVSAAEMNTALSEITANVDTANAAAAIGLLVYKPHFQRNPGQLDLMKRLDASVVSLQTP
jgi:hypothetical protein